MKRNIISNIFVVIFIVLLTVSCSSVDEEVAEPVVDEEPEAEQLYEDAEVFLKEKNYEKAVELFEEIERKYPFSPLATRAQIMTAFVHYKDEEYEDALAVLERFIKLHPGNVDIAYAYYLRSLCFYERIADIKRDQDITKKSLDTLNDVVVRFPDTEYAKDAKLKLDLANDHLAGKQMEIGRFYQNRKKYIAAINRFKIVIKDYGTTSHVPEALYRLTEVYLSLGVEPEAQKNAAVLGHNFPDSKWYEYAYRLVAGGSDSPLPERSDDSWYDVGLFGNNEEEIQAIPPPGQHEEKSWYDIF